jgi:hypothetical protein
MQVDIARRLRRARMRAIGAAVQAGGFASHLLIPHKKASVDRSVVLETWKAVADGAHNSNTDLIHWNGAFYLAHQTSPYHLGSRRSRLLLWRSKDARDWEKLAEFRNPEGEYRDPKFASINGRMFIYALPNVTLFADPITTVYTASEDGESWKPIEEIEPKGWLFWRPKTRDQKTWYVTAYWNKHGKSILLKSPDGENWETVSQIFEGERNDETDFELLAGGRILATGRLEGNGSGFGDSAASTFIATAAAPYKKWSITRSQVTRLDGPCLFPFNGRVYAVGRYQASFAPKLVQQGGIYSRKRTSLFAVNEDALVHLTDLPSAGDTSYAGIVIQGDQAYVSYYTSPIKDDYTWVTGMFRPTDIRMARIDLAAMERLALTHSSGGAS